jgi:hypothetical protein
MKYIKLLFDIEPVLLRETPRGVQMIPQISQSIKESAAARELIWTILNWSGYVSWS